MTSAPDVDRPEPDEEKLRDLVEELTVPEKARLVTGADLWTLPPIPRIGLHRLVLSDGPNGVRGPTWDERDNSLLLPVGSAVAATWDRSAARRVGELLGDEARRRGVHAVLAPTVNVHRSPFGGRNFENPSEDPRLISELGSEIVTGIQSRGVGAAPKHFVANDSETERFSYDVDVDERTLRELYLTPFEYIVTRTRPWMLMTAYNSVNGRAMTENARLVNEILKGEWSWDGVNVSDWYATRDLEGAAHGGLDLAMPGPDSPFGGGALVQAVTEGRIPGEVLDAKVRRILRLAARTGALGEPFDEQDDPSGTSGRPAAPDEARPVIRHLAARGFVLLRNESAEGTPLLPLDASALSTVAVVGENATLPAVQGGGSSQVNPPRIVTPLEGIRGVLDRAEVVHRRGVRHRRLLDPIPRERVTDPDEGGTGVRVDYLDENAQVLSSEVRGTNRLLWPGRQELPQRATGIRLRGRVELDGPGEHTFAVHGAGRFRVTVAGREVFDGRVPDEERPDRATGDSTANMPEQRISVVLMDSELDDHGTVLLDVEHTPAAGAIFPGVGLGYFRQDRDEQSELTAAVQAAREADVAVVVVGTHEEIETEGRDRSSLELPGGQDDLVRAVAAVNPRTVVVLNAGAPVLMPWMSEVPAVLWTWFGTQEYGSALADVLFGAEEPGGRLPMTLPAALTDVPVPLPGVQPVEGTLTYSEGTLVGYRAYSARGVAPLFPFGHGLGYTTWEYGGAAAESAEDGVRLRVAVRNAGTRAGREIVQVYERGPEGEPPRLVGFTVVEAEPGEGDTVSIDIEQRAFAHYDVDLPGWSVLSGEHELLIGRSLSDIRRTVIAQYP
ncbi:beta-glucosidase [Halopolyspora algeriensis]|uniref:Beta-glucosidase n=1 Tax=Halopolyspora algeriensis TaxID=1500506 RepID=A0A368VEI2_9ACTN|nr:glycoside hydrolase family 3 C-terminal domain-containing protein [Halopolyspora algeriensis]RCW39113.1 beta-glucosidase [Halopolyspora algeriensis]TQM56589.1 beta-glucosidase [Halopolyspora algeriensis]